MRISHSTLTFAVVMLVSPFRSSCPHDEARAQATTTSSAIGNTKRAASSQPRDAQYDLGSLKAPTLDEVIKSLEPVPSIQEALQPMVDNPNAPWRRRLAGKDKERADELERSISELRGQARFADAVPLAKEVVEIRKRAQGGDHWEAKDAADSVKMLRAFATMSVDAQAALAEAEAAGGKVQESFAAGRFKEAAEFAKRQLVIRRKVLGDHHVAIVEALHNVAATLLFTEEYESAEEAYRAALMLCLELFDEEHPMIALTEASLAGPLIRKRHYAAADALCRRALLTLRKTLGDDDPQVADLMNNYALLLTDRGDLPNGELLARRSLDITKVSHGRDSADYITNLNNLADPLWQQGKFDEAEQALREALAIARKVLGTQHELLATTLRNLGNVLQSEGRYWESELLHQEALDIRRATGESQEGIAVSLTNLAQLQFDLGQYDIAQKLHEESLTIRVGLLGQHNKGVAVNYLDLGLIYQAKGEYEEAARMFQEAREIYSHVLGGRNPEVATALSNLATVQRIRGDLKDAEASYREALRLKQEGLGPSHPDVAEIEHNLAALLYEKGDPDSLKECDRLYQAAISIRRGSKSPDLWRSLTGYAEFIAFKRAKPDDAIPFFREATELLESLRTFTAGDELDRAAASSRLAATTDPFAGLARAYLAARLNRQSEPAHSPDLGSLSAFSVLERGRGRALLDLLNRGPDDLYALALAKANRLNDQSLRTRIEGLRRLQTGARATLATAPLQIEGFKADRFIDEEQRDKSVSELRMRLDEARDADRQASRTLFEIARTELGSGGLAPLDAGQVVAKLKPGELLLTYDVGYEDTILLVTSNLGCIWSGLLKWPDGKDMTEASLASTIGPLVADFAHERLEGRATAINTSAHSRRDLFISLIPKLVYQELVQCERVIVIPHGPLYRLPFDAILVETAQDRRLLDVGPAIVYGPSATVELRKRRISRAKRPLNSESTSENRLELVALGNPILERPSEAVPTSQTSHQTAMEVTLSHKNVTRDLGELAPLPGTEEEVQAIAKIMRERGVEDRLMRILLGHEATLTNFVASANHPRFLHLATHGLAEGGRRAHESGLVFSMPIDPTPDDYGFLRLEDLIYKWGGKLEGTQLVVLSACRSAQGPLAYGEGMIALTWGFLYGGADAVVATLWKVDDAATRLLMTRLYENLGGQFEESRAAVPPRTGMPRSMALHEAKRWLRNLTADEARSLQARPSRGTRGAIGPLSGPANTQPVPVHPYADPYYWAAFILIGDPD